MNALSKRILLRLKQSKIYSILKKSDVLKAIYFPLMYGHNVGFGPKLRFSNKTIQNSLSES